MRDAEGRIRRAGGWSVFSLKELILYGDAAERCSALPPLPGCHLRVSSPRQVEATRQCGEPHSMVGCVQHAGEYSTTWKEGNGVDAFYMSR